MDDDDVLIDNDYYMREIAKQLTDANRNLVTVHQNLAAINATLIKYLEQIGGRV